MHIIDQITAEIKAVEGVSLIDVDPGKATNRTVVTLVGTPEEVCEAAFRAVKKASELIDMKKHKGAHPRFGATDVCPLVPVANITMEETVEYARKLAKRIGEELNIPVYCYENAAFVPERKNLATCRAGEYEALGERLSSEQWHPDFGENHPHPTAGVTVVGMRMPLVAFNVNIDCPDFSVADRIAKKVRFIGGGFRFCKAMGVDLAERKQVQVSMNMTDFTRTALYYSYEFIKMEAKRYGVEVIGSEVIGLVPYQALYACAEYSLMCQGKTAEEVQLMDEHDVVSAAEEYLKIENFSQSQVLEFKIKESN